MFRSGRRQLRHETECKCGHPEVCHYTKEGSCVYQACECVGFRGKGRAPFTNVRARCEYGHAHNSGTEIKECFGLHCQKLAGEISGYEAEKTLDLIGPSGAVIGTYKIDFVVSHVDGSTEYIECKGAHLQGDPAWRLKWALLNDMHKGDPLYKFRVVIG